MNWETHEVSADLIIRHAYSAKPVVVMLCLHGWTLDSRSFERQFDLTEYGIDIVTFDRRGCGQSPLAPSIDMDLVDLHQIVLSLELPVILYGVSQGARLALRYAQLHANHLKGLIFQGGLVHDYPFDGDREDEPPISAMRKLAISNRLDVLRSDWAKHRLMSAGLSHEDLNIVRKHLDAYQARDLLLQSDSVITARAPQKREKMRLPMLVAVAKQDSLQRRGHAQMLIEEHGASILQCDGGHLFNFSHSQVFNAGVRDWVSTLIR